LLREGELTEQEIEISRAYINAVINNNKTEQEEALAAMLKALSDMKEQMENLATNLKERTDETKMSPSANEA
jgi:hypothetical protein